MPESRDVKRALVLGASGFWGSWVVDNLVAAGVTVTGGSRSTRPPMLGLLGAHKSEEIDLDTEDLEWLLRGHDAIFYLAGRSSVPGSVAAPVPDLDGNVRTVVRILEILRRTESGATFVYASSGAVYGASRSMPILESAEVRPVSPYGVSKLFAEHYVRLYAQQFGVKAASVRPFSLYGPGQVKQVVYDLCNRVAGGENPLTIFGRPDITRDFIHVADASEAVCLVARNAPLGGEVYNIGSGRETTLAELAETIVTIAEKPDVIIRFTGTVRLGDPERMQADIEAIKALGFTQSRNSREGFEETYAWACEKH